MDYKSMFSYSLKSKYRNVKRGVFIILSLILFACNLNQPKVLVTNNSDLVYDSIKVFAKPEYPLSFKTVEKNTSVKGNITFDGKNQSDGAYVIQLYKGGELVKSRHFGYFTNGSSLNRKFTIILEPDTILVRMK